MALPIVADLARCCTNSYLTMLQENIPGPVPEPVPLALNSPKMFTHLLKPEGKILRQEYWKQNEAPYFMFLILRIAFRKALDWRAKTQHKRVDHDLSRMFTLSNRRYEALCLELVFSFLMSDTFRLLQWFCTTSIPFESC